MRATIHHLRWLWCNARAMAILSDPPLGFVSLPDAARRLGVARGSLNHLVREGRLAAERVGPHWYVDPVVLDAFAQTYRPSNRRRTVRPVNESREQVARLLADWQEATADELAIGVGLHPGNVRKHLVILEAAGVAERDDQAYWRLTEEGRRQYKEAAKAS